MGFTPPDPGIIADYLQTTIASLQKLGAEIQARAEVQEALTAAQAALAEVQKASGPSA